MTLLWQGILVKIIQDIEHVALMYLAGLSDDYITFNKKRGTVGC